jgi:predicted RNA-binding Zn ribbon-like protein
VPAGQGPAGQLHHLLDGEVHHAAGPGISAARVGEKSIVAHPDCVLHVDDTSHSGRRQWCSMAACGNRVKARRHDERAREG